MPVKSAPFYWIECDHCGKPPYYPDEDHPVWKSQDEAELEAAESDWHHSDVSGLWQCQDCGRLCEECGKPAGDLAGERDYHCQSCWDALEAGDA